MPVSGWIVDTRSKICPCLYFKKEGACCHVIAACIRAGVHFPGVRNDSREFVHPRRGAGRMHANRVVEVGNDRNDSARADTRLTTNDLGDSSPDEIETDDQSEPQSTENDGGDTGSDEDATNGTIATGLYNDHHLDAVSSQGSNNELDRDLPHPEIGAHPDSMAPDTELRVIANEVRDQTSQVVSNAHVAHSIQISAPQEAVPNADELQSAVDTQSIELQGTNADSSNGDYIDHSQVRRSCRAPKPTKRAIESRLQSGKRPRKKSG
ncbi:hypothetical protein F441_07012 [Phytophthora nicotianae CJ01A1]|uniref:SWIM-type domain-containing protein n=2 Tax=Phytophthora nicotianae TaxID=4792 RepID=W2X8Z1_PHYNI|nr:hypothetical protein F441_07012 [Phytophthora nicotianae CJ01A1]